ncbi:MAG: 50S ribosomal protein L25 [Anaerolineales bacterium]|nr:50S ribosomal protein L25 [Anaerolineales bacterium]MCX7609643.1 50S ribosomal protein L25 [Anaerolineales bacterium]MDW8226674.1 50S ribosomal protein L25 [Anaerolineales bacterium]
MEKIVIKAKPRTITGKQVRALRRAGELPGVIYGHKLQPINISMNAHDASLILERITSSSLVTIDLEGKEYPALVREKQRHPIKRTLLHVDFQAISLNEAIRAKVGVQLVGASPAVKDLNAVLVPGLDEVEVECLPQDLPERIVVDISSLAKIGDAIHVRDLVLPEKVRVLDDPEEIIALVTLAKEEEVVEEVGEAEPEVIEKGKKEEEIEE